MSPLWKKAVIAVGAGALGFGCAHTVSKPLSDARAAYERAQQSQTAQISPRELQQARIALDRAERYAKEHPNDAEAQDLAYVALRRVETAESLTRARLAREQVLTAQAQIRQRKEAQAREQQSNLEQQLATERQELEKQRQQLEQERAQGEQQAQLSQLEAERQAQQQRVAELEQQLQQERQARAAAEQTAQQSKEELQKIGQVREESRGLVLTLPGNLLFKSGSTKLAPQSEGELKELATALEKLPDQKVTIEGHSDSRGPEETNQEISFERAQAVRLFLIDQGVDPRRLAVVGFGELRPVAANDSADGRAMNRRVEIVLEKQPAQGVGGSGTQEKQPGEKGTGGAGTEQQPPPPQTQPAEPGEGTGGAGEQPQPTEPGEGTGGSGTEQQPPPASTQPAQPGQDQQPPPPEKTPPSRAP